MGDHPPLPQREPIREWVEEHADQFDTDDLEAVTDEIHQQIAAEHIGKAVRAGRLVRKVTIGLGMFDPAYPFHGAIRPCPHCGEPYRVHGGFADHRDRCEQNPINQDHPERIADGGIDTATIDLSCPNGCFDLEVSGGHATRDSREFLEDTAVSDDAGECPNCGADIGGETHA